MMEKKQQQAREGRENKKQKKGIEQEKKVEATTTRQGRVQGVI